MFEDTNQADMGVDDGSDLFLDEQTEAETPEKQEAEKMETPPADEKTEEPGKEGEKESEKEPGKESSKEPTIRVKFNGEEKDIPIAEATILAQKGMNYDKIVKERDELKNSDEIRELDLWAKQLGMTRQEFVKGLATQREDAIIQKALQEVQSEFPDISEKAALEIAKTRTAEKRQQVENDVKKADEAAQAEKLKPWKDFIERYNIKDAKEIPQTVADEMANGVPPIEAMQRYELAEMKKQLDEVQKKQAASDKNKENKQKALGSAASAGQETQPDAFLSGFMNG